MPKIAMEHQEEYRTLPADSILNVKCTKIEINEQQGKRSTWEKMDCTFKILGIQVVGDGSDPSEFDTLIGREIYGGVGFKLTDHPDNKLRQWTEALLGMEIGPGFELDTDYLVGREARAITRVYDKRTVNPQTGRPYQGMGVESLLPKAARSQQAPQAQPASWGQAMQQPAPQQPPQPAPQQAPSHDPWTGNPVAQPQAQPQFSGWGASGTDDPPF